VKKLLALIVLLAAAAALWLGARYVAHRGEVRATIMFRSAEGLEVGDDVVEGATVVGKVTHVVHLDGEDAVSIRLDRDHRRAVVNDSLFAVDGRQLTVTNTLAVGAPVEDGAVLKAREDRVSRWLARHGSSVQPFMEKLKRAADSRLDQLDADHIEASLTRWKAEVPDWKAEGREALDRHLADLRERVDKSAAELKRSNRAAEARELTEKFERWLQEVRAEVRR
jgi:ABC-type transporter Mla subunit MlaD